MPTFAQTLDLKDDPKLIAEYLRHHEAVWPEVVRALRDMGLSNMRIYRHGTRLFMVFDAAANFDPARDYQRYANDPACRKWDELMRQYQQPSPGAAPGEWWSSMNLVFEMA